MHGFKLPNFLLYACTQMYVYMCVCVWYVFALVHFDARSDTMRTMTTYTHIHSTQTHYIHVQRPLQNTFNAPPGHVYCHATVSIHIYIYIYIYIYICIYIYYFCDVDTQEIVKKAYQITNEQKNVKSTHQSACASRKKKAKKHQAKKISKKHSIDTRKKSIKQKKSSQKTPSIYMCGDTRKKNAHARTHTHTQDLSCHCFKANAHHASAHINTRTHRYKQNIHLNTSEHIPPKFLKHPLQKAPIPS